MARCLPAPCRAACKAHPARSTQVDLTGGRGVLGLPPAGIAWSCGDYCSAPQLVGTDESQGRSCVECLASAANPWSCYNVRLCRGTACAARGGRHACVCVACL